MAAKKGKSKSAKVSSLKSKKLGADQAGAVKGGALISNTQGVFKTPTTQVSNSAWKLDAASSAWKFKA